MNKFFVAVAIVAVSGLAMLPASAADIDINLGVAGTGIAQSATVSALSDLKSTADITQVFGLNSLEGAWTDDVDALVLASGITQAAQAAAAVAPGSPMSAKSIAEITQVVGLNSLDLANVVGGADINVGARVTGINQTAVAGAIGTASAMASASQLTGVNTVSVNITP